MLYVTRAVGTVALSVHLLCVNRFPCATVPFHAIPFLSSPEMKTGKVQL